MAGLFRLSLAYWFTLKAAINRVAAETPLETGLASSQRLD